MASLIRDPVQLIMRESAHDPGTPTMVDFRFFDKIRNFGQAIVHDTTDVVVEFFDERNSWYNPKSISLARYHKPSYTYTVRTRKTFLILSYAVALELGRSNEPFNDIKNELVYSKPCKIVCIEKPLIYAFNDAMKCSIGQHIWGNTEYDGILTNNTHSAIFTSFPVFDIAAIRKFYHQCMFAHYYQKNSQDQGQTSKFWQGFFAPQKTVNLYAGFRLPTLNAQQIEVCRAHNIRPLIQGPLHMQLV